MKNEETTPWFMKIASAITMLLSKFQYIELPHIPMEGNKAAHYLVVNTKVMREVVPMVPNSVLYLKLRGDQI